MDILDREKNQIHRANATEPVRQVMVLWSTPNLIGGVPRHPFTAAKFRIWISPLIINRDPRNAV